MIIDVTGIELIPGNGGRDCPGNGHCINENGDLIECCCDECDYAVCCLEDSVFNIYPVEFYHQISCEECTDDDCPKSLKNK